MSDRQVDAKLHWGPVARRGLLPVLAVLALLAPLVASQAMEETARSDVGTVWWTELRTRDVPKVQSFYADVFGWTSKTVAEDDNSRAPRDGEQSYTVFSAHGQEVAGVERITPSDTAQSRPGWLNYVQVVDVDAAARKALEKGGKIIQAPVDLPSVGRMAEIEDPEGNRVGLVSPRK